MTDHCDMSLTWPEALHAARAVIENAPDDIKAMAWAELERMAEIAQLHVDEATTKEDWHAA